MKIDRDKDQGNTALKRVRFCLNQLEKAQEFKENIGWNTIIVDELSLEEMIGALVSAEQYIKEAEEEIEYQEKLDTPQS